jgi:hypothetical protein
MKGKVGSNVVVIRFNIGTQQLEKAKPVIYQPIP